jgi:hypothetical protein
MYLASPYLGDQTLPGEIKRVWCPMQEEIDVPNLEVLADTWLDGEPAP